MKSRILTYIIAMTLFVTATVLFVRGAQAQTITTFAGGGPNNIPALSAGLAFAPGVAVDHAENIFISDADENYVYKVDSSGVLTVFAGNGTPAYGGDGGPATSAQLLGPFGLVVDASGNVFIADTVNNVVRKVDTGGTITTIAGNGTAGFGGDGGPATSAMLHFPTGLALDSSGDLFITDFGNQRVREINTSGTITTVAGNGTAGFSGDGGPATAAMLNNPFTVAVDSSGDIFIADSANNRIREVNATGTITTVAGTGTAGFNGDNGPATSALLNSPHGVAVDSSGNIFIADTLNGQMREVDTTTGMILYAGGNGPPGLSTPFAVAVDGSDNLFIADVWPVALPAPNGAWRPIVDPSNTLFASGPSEGDQQIRQADTGGNVTVFAGNAWGLTNVVGDPWASFGGDGSSAAGAELSAPAGVAFDTLGNLFIPDNNRIRKVATNGIITTVAGTGSICPGPTSPCGDGGPADDARFWDPVATAVDTSGNLFIADYYTQRIRKVDTNGIITTLTGSNGELAGPTGVAVDTMDNVFIADRQSNRVLKVNSSGVLSLVAGTGTAGYSGDGGPATSAELNSPYELTLDSSGNLYITDALNEVVRKVNSSGIITTVAGKGNPYCPLPTSPCGDGGPASDAQFAYLGGIAVDSSGDIFLGDIFDERVREVNASTGIITTVAGNGVVGFSGDGGSPTSAEMNTPTGVALDSFGRLFIADQYNERIREVSLPADFSITPASTTLTLQPGGQGTDVITLAPLNDPFGNAIQLTCAVAGPAPMPSCALSATPVTPGAMSATSTLTITAPAAAAMQLPFSRRPQLGKSLYAVWLPLMFGITLVGRARKQWRRYWMIGVFPLLVLVLQLGCGGSSGNSAVHQPTNYTVTVTAASGTITHTTNVTVTVQ